MNKCSICEIESEDLTLHTKWCIECEVCQKRFTKHDIEIINLFGSNLLACSVCSIVKKMDIYKEQLTLSLDRENELKHKLNMFKSVMLSPATMAAIADDPLTDWPSAISIKRRCEGLEALSIDQLMHWMETYELYAREISTLINRKIKPEELRAHLANKTKEAVASQAKKQIEIKKASNQGLAGDYTQIEKKAILGLMKGPLKLSEKAAVDMLKIIPKGQNS